MGISVSLQKNITNEELIHIAGEKIRKGLKVAVATIVRKEGSGPRDVGSKILVSEDGEVYGTLGGGFFEKHIVGEALKVFKEGRPKLIRYSFSGRPVEGAVDTGLICGGFLEVFIEVWAPTQRVLVFGTGRVGKPLSDILNFLGFKVVIADPNPELVSSDLYPYAEARVCVPAEEIESRLPELIRDGDIVFVTHGEVETDYKALKTALKTGAKLVGVLGSKNKIREFARRLVSDGLEKELIRTKFRGPIGVDIAADTPEEIAVAVATELIAILKGGTVRTLNIVDELLKN